MDFMIELIFYLSKLFAGGVRSLKYAKPDYL